MRAYALLGNGMGAIDWSGFEIVSEYLGVRDHADLIHRIEVIKRFVGARKANEDDNTKTKHPNDGHRETLD